MDVLFLAHRAPFPPDKGDRLRAWRHIERLSAFGPVDVVAQADDERAAERAVSGLQSVCREVHVFTRQRLGAASHMARNLVGGGSLTVGWHTDRRVERALESLTDRHDYGLCWAFSSGTGPWWRRAQAQHHIMDLCDLDALKWQALGQDGAGVRGWLHRTEARRLLPLELELAAEADLVLVSTRQEAQDLAARGDPRRLEVLTNGVSWESFDALPAPSQVPPVVGFLGQMDYPPNVQAACHLAREVMPRVRARMPAARLAILGRAPSPDVRALADDHVTVAGEVASVPEALAGVAVFVAPLDKGRGIPNKILEALAAGRATVVSEWSARALSGEPGRDYLVVDGVEERAETVAALLADGARCDALGAAGRAYVREHHDWGRVLDRLEGLVREVTGA